MEKKSIQQLGRTMNSLIDFAFKKFKSIIIIFITIMIVGALSYKNIPKEAAPEVKIPIAYISTSLDGISPSDAERLLIKPLETEISAINGLKKYTSTASEGYGSITLEFEAGYDLKTAINDTKDAVDKAKKNLPSEAKEPTVNEVNTALFPILTIVLSGPIPERSLNAIATEFKDQIEQVKGVLEVNINGNRDDLVEITISPTVFETYGLSFNEITQQVTKNNRLIAAGNLQTKTGKLILKAPGLIQNIDDIYNMPIKTRGKEVVKFSDIANIKRILEDPNGFARINGYPALTLEIKKKVGANIIETIDTIKFKIKENEQNFPKNLNITYLQDESKQVKSMLSDLENNVIASILLVMIVILFSLGFNSAILVGLSIPGSFLAGIILLSISGNTLNIVVLFSLILVVGMLVDAAIVTVEYADRKLSEGYNAKDSYLIAAKRMALPIIASTATTLCVFLPLLFWNEVVGQFMKYLPITVLYTLGASLFVALIFIPVFGSIFARRKSVTKKEYETLKNIEEGDPNLTTGVIGFYVKILNSTIKFPKTTILLTFLLFILVFQAYGKLGSGVSFFPSIEPDFAQVQIKSNDNFSIYERDIIVKNIEKDLMKIDGIKTVSSKTLFGSSGQNSSEDQIGIIQIEFKPWDERKKAELIYNDIRNLEKSHFGLKIQVQGAQSGPGGGKPINLKIMSDNILEQNKTTDALLNYMKSSGQFKDTTDSRPIKGLEWQINVNRSEASKYGADIASLGEAIKLITRGVQIADYTPDDVDDTVDIVIRFPEEDRTLESLYNLKIPTNNGLIPISNFVEIVPTNKIGIINRFNGSRTVNIESDLSPGRLADDVIKELKNFIQENKIETDNVKILFSGEAEDQANAMKFLIGAFGSAIFMMFLILLIQFNSIWQSLIVMSAIVFSIGGVLLGLMITGRPFGIVMSGIGIISLAGIVINNNILLIDTFNEFTDKGYDKMTSALRTGASRFRPVILTSLTTALGLLPMILGMNINFANRTIQFGAPSTQWWIELSTTISGGLIFSTLITLLVTPSFLVLNKKKGSIKPPFISIFLKKN